MGLAVKHMRLLAVILVSAMVLALTACGNQQDNKQNHNTLPERKPDNVLNQVEKENEKGADSEKEWPDELSKTWSRSDDAESEEVVTRLILSEDGTAQLPIQNGIGELLGLCFGSWYVENGILTLTLTPDSAMGTFFNPEWKTIGGDYSYSVDENGILYLTDLDNPCPIVPYMSGMMLPFESDEAAYEREKQETEILDTVTRYYNAQNESDYSGYAEISGRNEDGTLLIHLYEDMGDHIATAAWYTIDPVTYQGYDDVEGGSIDFSPYREIYVG